MRVGIDARELLKNKVTGIGRFLDGFLKEAKNYNEFEFVLFGNQDNDFNRECLQDYKKNVINEKNRLWWDQITLKNALNKSAIEIFFSPYYKIPLLANLPKINFVFDLIPFVVNEYKNKFENKCWLKYFAKLMFDNADIILTCSNNSKNDLVKIFNVPEKKVSVVPLCVDTRFKPVPEKDIINIKNKYDIKKKYILYVGNSEPHKNLNRLIEAFSILPQDMRDEYQLILAGVSSYQQSTSNYQLIHYVPESDLPALYRGAELFVFPSLYEGFGLPPLEAMACGCPVASSNVSSMPEILGNACEYFNPVNIEEMSSVIKKTLTDTELRKKLKQKGFEQAKSYTAGKMTSMIVKTMKTVYESKNV